MEQCKISEIIIIGGGAAGLMAGIAAARCGKSVFIAEKMSAPGCKLLTTGGGRCNITNTYSTDDFMAGFKQGRFMQPALAAMSSVKLREFFAGIGVQTHSPDGVHVFPITHKAETVRQGLRQELKKSGVSIVADCTVQSIDYGGVIRLATTKGNFSCQRVIIATGGLSYPETGATGDGYKFAKAVGHRIEPTFPGGIGLKTQEKWPSTCRADTIAKVKVSIQGKGRTPVKRGDLIFTSDGIAGPVILDLSREVTPRLKDGPVTLLLQLTNKTKQDWQDCFRNWKGDQAATALAELLATIFPLALAHALCQLAAIEPSTPLKALKPVQLDALAKLLVAVPITVIAGDQDGFVTRGGVNLKEVSPHTLESKLKGGLFFCGEVLDLDGPCGGFNLQWAFASGYLAGQCAANSL